jgi:FkbM family methyltransferase
MNNYDELQMLLSESVIDAMTRESTVFNELAGGFNKSLVLFGAGKLGRKTLMGLRKEGIEPLAFTDNNPSLWGQLVEGVRVYPPQEAAQRFGQSATFIITIWTGRGHQMAPVITQLKQMHCNTVIPFPFLFWKYHERFLPHYSIDLPHLILEEKEDIMEAYSLWSDDFSRQEFIAQIKWRLYSDWNSLSGPVAGEQYFLDDVFSVNKDEAFIDCGAFNGDTLKTFLCRQGTLFRKYIAFEPDPINYSDLQCYVSSLSEAISSKIDSFPYAISGQREKVTFCSTGEVGSCISKSGSILVECIPLDELLTTEKPSFIKMDIEGSEQNALDGAREIINKEYPILAICVYHIKNDLWKIPLQIYDINQNYHLFLRPHGDDCWDTVCYAVPKNRLLTI